MIHVGIAGIGFLGMIHYLACQRLSKVRVRAICDPDPQRLSGDWRSIRGSFGPQGRMMDLSGVSRYARLEEMLLDPRLDLIDLCLPPAARPAAAIAALRAGKHVFCEKPMALRTADAERMLSAAETAGRLLLIGHVLPFFPEYRFVYQTVVTGKYGRLLGGSFKRVISDPRWLADFYDPDTSGGPMIDLHIHDAHFIRLLCGMPRQVQSAGRMRGEVVERFHTQFLFDDPADGATPPSRVIAQQRRPNTP
jgi:predicted dehydrogenase